MAVVCNPMVRGVVGRYSTRFTIQAANFATTLGKFAAIIGA